MGLKPNHFVSLAKTEQIFLKDGRSYTKRLTRFRYFFPDEWMAFYDSLNTRQKITFKFLINTGARISEVANITVSDIDFDRQSILMRMTKGRYKDGTRKMRIITVSSEFTKWLRNLIKKLDLQPTDKFPILSIPAANICMKKNLKLVGVKDYYMISVHNVRKTLETWLLALDIDSLRVAKHFGHDLATASKYYVSSDAFSYEEKKEMRQIIGDLMEKR